MRRVAACIALGVAIAMSACATSPRTPGLANRVGETVALHGVLRGQAKMGYVIDVDGETVFADVNGDFGAHVGEKVVVRGTLQRTDPNVECPTAEPCATPPADALFVSGATLEFDD
jgi:hypothetical protein